MTTHRVHFFHLIWSTKYRKNLILPKMMPDLFAYMAGTIKNNEGALLEIGGIENHLHLLIEVSNLDKFTMIVRNVKTSSSHWLKKNFPECKNFSWQDGYGSYTVSYSQIENVRKYIQNQAEHHKKISYESEYLRFLDTCKVEYNQKFVFENEF